MTTKRTATEGFTLVEVMIVIAIIGVLAAISIPAYQDYVENSNMAKVTTHYEGGIRFAEVELRKVQTDLTVGRIANLADADATGNYTPAEAPRPAAATRTWKATATATPARSA